MELFKRQPLLVGLLFLLLSIRFVIVPIIDWQNQSLEQIKSLQKKQQKTQVAIDREADNQMQLQNLESQKVAFNRLFFAAGNEAKFKLERQQWLEALLARHKLKVVNIGWMNSAKMQNVDVFKHSLQFGFEGHGTNIPAFQSEIEDSKEWIQLVSLSISMSKQNKLELGQARGNYQLNFFQLMTGNPEVNND
jgi:hypothetical protein